MNSYIPSYAMLAIHLKWRQGKILSTLLRGFSVCFMQMSYLLKKQKIHLPNLITVIYLFRRQEDAYFRKKTNYNVIAFTETLLIDLVFL